MEAKQIPAILVNGFMDAGKTTYIHDCLKNDFYYKRGKTLLISFEEGDEEYDSDLLTSRNTVLSIYPGSGDIADFLAGQVSLHQPDRLYLEMNGMMGQLREQLPDWIKVIFSITLIDGSTLSLYYNNMRQLLQNMVTDSHQVIFNRCSQESLSPYGNVFRIMNRKASYLWEGPTGYHEKAFGVMVPFDLNAEELVLTDADYSPFYLDALESPDHYSGKIIQLLCRISQDPDGQTGWKAGRQVMTCCLADVQFLGFPCRMTDPSTEVDGTWYQLKAIGRVQTDRYRQKYLMLEVVGTEECVPPKQQVIGL